MRVIGIDPGYERLGIAILDKNGSAETLVYSDCYRTPSKLPFPDRLHLLGTEIARLIQEYKPEALATETLFFTNNQKTAMPVSEARGVILYEAKRAKLIVQEFTPQQIKMALTSNGRSDKQQVTRMVQMLLPDIAKKVALDDEYDAIAIVLTYFATHKALARK